MAMTRSDARRSWGFAGTVAGLTAMFVASLGGLFGPGAFAPDFVAEPQVRVQPMFIPMPYMVEGDTTTPVVDPGATVVVAAPVLSTPDGPIASTPPTARSTPPVVPPTTAPPVTSPPAPPPVTQLSQPENVVDQVVDMVQDLLDGLLP